MHETFLHYIWQYQYFDKRDLQSIEGEKITVFNPGMPNLDAGPDFLNAKIKIGSIEWSGSVEIHTHSSEWNQHHHDRDSAYSNVVLHVVWKNNKTIKRMDGTSIPTLELSGRIEPTLIARYKKLVNNPASIPCQSQISKVNDLVKLNMIDRALALRFERKSKEVLAVLSANKNNWEETTYQLLAKNFGFKINADPFYTLAKSIPLKILQKHFGNFLQIESLLFGQAGFLDNVGKSEYEKSLVREYRILAKKYELDPIHRSQWKFLRLRPANFPTLRIAQFTSLINSRKNLFSLLIESDDLKSLQKLFQSTPSDFWSSHYQFGNSKKVTKNSSIGTKSLENILINTVIPIWIAYGKQKDQQDFVDRSIYALQQIQAEQNSIIKRWTALGLKPKSAHDSQALISQYNDLCKKKNCLKCVVGHALLRNKS